MATVARRRVTAKGELASLVPTASETAQRRPSIQESSGILSGACPVGKATSAASGTAAWALPARERLLRSSGRVQTQLPRTRPAEAATVYLRDFTKSTTVNGSTYRAWRAAKQNVSSSQASCRARIDSGWPQSTE